MGDRFVAFDIETAKVLPDYVVDLKSHRPLGIACAAAALSDVKRPIVWHGVGDDGPAPQMSPADVGEVVDQLRTWVDAGYQLVTWNGLSFDFDVLSEESGRRSECTTLALGHIDMMFQAVCVLGHRISLAKVAEGMRLSGKSAGMTGSKAPVLWAAGEHQKMLKYVEQDAKLTLQVAENAERLGELPWITGRGQLRAMPLRSGWLCVEDCCGLPLPDTSWMDDPPRREDFTNWLRH